MESGIPAIAPKGTRAGDFSTVSYNNTDPDCWWSWNKCTTPKIAGLADDTTRCDEPLTWGLTLDDGPNCSHNAYYDYLKEQEQKATMFFIGSNVMDWPLEAQRALGDGHEICVHSKPGLATHHHLAISADPFSLASQPGRTLTCSSRLELYDACCG